MQNKIRETFILKDQILKYLRLHCELNPFNLVKISNFKFYQFFFALILLVEFIVINCYVFIGFYNVKNDFFSTIQLFINVISTIQTYLNNYRLSKKYDELKKLLEATSSDFLSSSHKGKYIFEQNESICMKIISIYVFICYSSGLLWILNPLFIKEFYFKTRDDSLVIYRNSILNTLLSFIPILVYKRIYPIVCLIEAFEVLHFTFDIVFYFTIVIHFCWMLSAQLKIMAYKCESFGYENDELGVYEVIRINFLFSIFFERTKEKHNIFNASNVFNEEFIFQIGNRNDRNYMINLKQLLSDYTKLHVSIRKFYEIMKPMTWFTYVYYFNLFNAFTYLFILNYFKNDYVLSVTSAKLLLTLSVLCIDLLINCYFYGYLENQINGVQFALYSIDWTQKSIKFKKILMLVMSLNNTNRLKMNITPQKSLNLEVFGSALRVSYSIISLLVKKTISK